MAASLSINLTRMSLPLAHCGQVLRSLPVSACSICCQVLFFLGVSIVGLEIFDSHRSLVNYYDKMIQSYALDALDLLMQGQSPPKKQPKVDNWLREVTALPLAASPSLGLGEDLRLESQEVIGSGLLHEDTVLYLAVFPKASSGVKSGMARASRRDLFTG
jgi:hypothetical protein